MSHPPRQACALFSVQAWRSPRRAPVPQSLSLPSLLSRGRGKGPEESRAWPRLGESPPQAASEQTRLPQKVSFFSGHEESGSGEGVAGADEAQAPARDAGTNGGPLGCWSSWCPRRQPRPLCQQPQLRGDTGPLQGHSCPHQAWEARGAEPLNPAQQPKPR